MTPNRRSGFDQGEYDRPVRVLTAANASVVDRASAWRAVELAIIAVNQRATALGVPVVAGLEEAQRAHHAAVASLPPGSVVAAEGWRRCVRAQFRLLVTCVTLEWADRMREPMERLRAARERYLELGGEPSRAPMAGAPS